MSREPPREVQQEIIQQMFKMPESGRKSDHAIEMNYPTDWKGTQRRCGQCGEYKEGSSFKVGKKPGYGYKCEECRQ